MRPLFSATRDGAIQFAVRVSPRSSRQAIEGLAVATPILLLASFLGLRAFDRISTRAFQRAVVMLAIVGAVTLIAKQL